MSETIRVNVTTRHIDQGCPGELDNCALALALKDAGYPGVTVGPSMVWLDGLPGVRYAALPSEAVRFRNRFDTGRSVLPISFDLDIQRVVGVPS